MVTSLFLFQFFLFIESVRSFINKEPPSNRRGAPTKLQQTNDNENPSSNVPVLAIPFLPCSPILADCNLAGNVGFDPLNMATSRASLLLYREMEVKHGRLAMLAAAGWPISEIFDGRIAQDWGMPQLLTDGGRAPSLLNGGMGNVSPVWWGICLGLTAAIDLYANDKAKYSGDDYFPGNLGFDPLGFYPPDASGKKRMELAEIKHGRLAMMAVAGFATQEYVTKISVVHETPLFFFPVTPIYRSTRLTDHHFSMDLFKIFHSISGRAKSLYNLDMMMLRTVLIIAFCVPEALCFTQSEVRRATPGGLCHQQKKELFRCRPNLLHPGHSPLRLSAAVTKESISHLAKVVFNYEGNVPFLYSLGINVFLFTILRSKLLSALTPAGFVNALALGIMLWMTLGWRGWSYCVLYLVLGQLVTKIRFADKEQRGLAEGRGGRRGPENVWGSAATSLACAVCAAHGKAEFLGISSPLYALGFCAGLATKLADTFASEIGKAYGKTTFLITNFKKSEPGVEGAVSVEGTVAAAFGGLLLSSYGLWIGLIDLRMLAISTVAAFIATNVESFLGATIQEGKWITNEVINFLNTAIGAAIAIGAAKLLLKL